MYRGHASGSGYHRQASGGADYHRQASGGSDYHRQASGGADYHRQASGGPDYHRQASMASGGSDYHRQASGGSDYHRQASGGADYHRQAAGYRPSMPDEWEIHQAPQTSGGSRRHRIRHTRTRRQRNYISPCIKCLLFSFNFLFWLVGLSVALLGVWILVEKDKHIRDVLDVFFDPSILMCLAGFIIFSLGFFGCLGALRENICLLQTFHILLTVILVLELLLGILIFIFYYVPKARQQLGFLGPEEALKEAIIRYRDDADLRDMIDTIQREFKCCGVSNTDYGYRDWEKNMYFNCSPENPSVERCGVPHSCCIVSPGDMINVMCGFDTTNHERAEAGERVYVQGCLKGFGAWLERNTIIIGAIFLGIIIPQILGICLARSLIDQVKQQMAQWSYS